MPGTGHDTAARRDPGRDGRGRSRRRGCRSLGWERYDSTPRGPATPAPGPVRPEERRRSAVSLARAVDLRPEDLAGKSWAGYVRESTRGQADRYGPEIQRTEQLRFA